MAPDINQQNIVINTDYIKLDQLLKFAGFCETGGQAKELIADGRCIVNGTPCLMRGKKLRTGDQITLSGRTVIIINES